MSKEIVLSIEGMSCGHCVKTITDGLKQLEGVEDVKVRLQEKNARITLGPNPLSIEEIKYKIVDLGYEVK